MTRSVVVRCGRERYRLRRRLIDGQPEHVGPGIVAHHVEVEFRPGECGPVEVPRDDALLPVNRPGQEVDGALAYSASQNNYESVERGFSNNEAGSLPAGFIATRPNVQSWEWQFRQTGGNDWNDLRNFVNTDSRAGGTRVNNDNRTWRTNKWTGTLNARWIVPFMEKFQPITNHQSPITNHQSIIINIFNTW